MGQDVSCTPEDCAVCEERFGGDDQHPYPAQVKIRYANGGEMYPQPLLKLPARNEDCRARSTCCEIQREDSSARYNAVETVPVLVSTWQVGAGPVQAPFVEGAKRCRADEQSLLAPHARRRPASFDHGTESEAPRVGSSTGPKRGPALLPEGRVRDIKDKASGEEPKPTSASGSLLAASPPQPAGRLVPRQPSVSNASNGRNTPGAPPPSPLASPSGGAVSGGYSPSTPAPANSAWLQESPMRALQHNRSSPSFAAIPENIPSAGSPYRSSLSGSYVASSNGSYVASGGSYVAAGGEQSTYRVPQTVIGRQQSANGHERGVEVQVDCINDKKSQSALAGDVSPRSGGLRILAVFPGQETQISSRNSPLPQACDSFNCHDDGRSSCGWTPASSIKGSAKTKPPLMKSMGGPFVEMDDTFIHQGSPARFVEMDDPMIRILAPAITVDRI